MVGYMLGSLQAHRGCTNRQGRGACYRGNRTRGLISEPADGDEHGDYIHFYTIQYCTVQCTVLKRTGRGVLLSEPADGDEHGDADVPPSPHPVPHEFLAIQYGSGPEALKPTSTRAWFMFTFLGQSVPRNTPVLYACAHREPGAGRGGPVNARPARGLPGLYPGCTKGVPGVFLQHPPAPFPLPSVHARGGAGRARHSLSHSTGGTPRGTPTAYHEGLGGEDEDDRGVLRDGLHEGVGGAGRKLLPPRDLAGEQGGVDGGALLVVPGQVGVGGEGATPLLSCANWKVHSGQPPLQHFLNPQSQTCCGERGMGVRKWLRRDHFIEMMSAAAASQQLSHCDRHKAYKDRRSRDTVSLCHYVLVSLH